ncbi:tyrosine-type recombinase/integrase [Brevibacillus parabrevis]|uniref:tyrosine-type recombinase/integrase n=1 Tax=Brevibacillus parabrevis TaxID=54914 RepID=UPI0028D54856|nr:tyrosine-type recombinase/integrase [Brevibacillus parabrevis]
MKTMIATESMLLTQAIPLFLDWLKARGMRDETLRGYKMDVSQFQRWMSERSNGPVFVDEVTFAHVEGFVEYLSNELDSKPRTINRKINALSTFFTCLKKKKLVQENPVDDIERVKVPESERIYLNKEEIEAIIAAIKHPVVHYFAMMMAHTGIRVNECINLTLHDVDLEEGFVQVVNGKGGKNRRVPMNKQLVQHMKEYLDKHRPHTASLFFFALKKTGTVSEQYVNRLLKEACQDVGIQKHVTSHILRHSFASYLVKKDTHVAVIQRLLGHASLKTTSVYLHVQQTDLQEAVNRIDF